MDSKPSMHLGIHKSRSKVSIFGGGTLIHIPYQRHSASRGMPVRYSGQVRALELAEKIKRLLEEQDG